MWSFFKQNFLPTQYCWCCQIQPAQRYGFCPDCWNDLPLIKDGCLSCGLPKQQGFCSCHPEEWPFQRVVCGGLYQFPLAHMLHQYKQYHQINLAEPLAQLLVARLQQLQLPLPSLIISTPAAPERLSERGFDTARVLAQRVSHALRLPLAPPVLARRAGSLAQKNLTAAQRQLNIANAFFWQEDIQLPKRVALFDDVLTTGATSKHLFTLLQEAGAEQIQLWTIVRTPKTSNG